MLHYQAEAAARSHGFPLTRRIEKEEQRELVGLHLEPKLRLARELKVLTAEESEFVVTNHYYRNEVYHRGLRHNRVIWDLAWHYHAFACALVPKINAGLIRKRLGNVAAIRRRMNVWPRRSSPAQIPSSGSGSSLSRRSRAIRSNRGLAGPVRSALR